MTFQLLGKSKFIQEARLQDLVLRGCFALEEMPDCLPEWLPCCGTARRDELCRFTAASWCSAGSAPWLF